jgi:hypothetical protein
MGRFLRLTTPETFRLSTFIFPIQPNFLQNKKKNAEICRKYYIFSFKFRRFILDTLF